MRKSASFQNILRIGLPCVMTLLGLALFAFSRRAHTPDPLHAPDASHTPGSTQASIISAPEDAQAPGNPPPKKKLVVIGYVGGYKGLIRDSIDVSRLSHINYAFVDIKDDRAWLHHPATDTANLRYLVGLKARNPDLKIIISIGGWSWSKLFSDAVLTDSSRSVLAQSAVAIVRQYELDGIDIDWEFPAQIGDGNKFRPEDKQNYTLCFKRLRQELDSLARITAKKYYITTAVGTDRAFLANTEMGEAQHYLDYVNIMSYDFHGNEGAMSGHHTNLYASKQDPDTTLSSADKAVHMFEQAGVPSSKLVLGIAFYAHAWTTKSADHHGLYQPAEKTEQNRLFHMVSDGGDGYTYIKDSVAGKNGFVRYWDADAHAPYLFHPDRHILISYDDEESARDKCKYAEKNKLAGVMFWEYVSDRKGYLLRAIGDELGYNK